MTFWQITVLLLTLPIAIPCTLFLDSVPGDDFAHSTPYYPRLLNWFVALYGGYFWSDCPICGTNFGGHESRGGGLCTSYGGGVCTCYKCNEKTEEINKKNNYFIPKTR